MSSQPALETKLLSFLQKSFASAVGTSEHDEDIDVLASLIDTIRPKSEKKLESYSIAPLLEILQQNAEIRKHLTQYLHFCIRHKYKFSGIIADAGIIKGTSFYTELKTRLFGKIMPINPPKDNLEYLINQLFYDPKDILWLRKIPIAEIMQLLALVDMGEISEEAKVHTIHELNRGVEIILLRICGRVMENDVLKMVPEYDAKDNPFSIYQKELDLIFETLESSKGHSAIINRNKLIVLHQQCERFLNDAFANTRKYGISMNVNQNLVRIRQQLQRVERFVDDFIMHKYDTEMDRAVHLYLDLIELNCYKNTVANLFDESTNLLAYEITQHSAKTGEFYITDNWKEFGKMLYSALGGGLIVGILVVNKVIIAQMNLSNFGYAVGYSLNYSIGFIAIFLCGFTLATKQPAMTAATLMRSLKESYDNSEDDNRYSEFGRLFSRLVRSQLIAFVGNVAMALPIAMIGIWGIDYLFGINIAEKRWPKLMTDLSPWHSLAILHASIAGFYLFLSGLISGYISNRNKHFDIPLRIKENPMLRRNFSKERLRKWSTTFEQKWPGIVSNFWFGTFLGSTWSLGQFFGLNLDIRHITFAAGNFSLGLYGSAFSASASMIIWAILGIFIIGFFNFMVSFMLSLTLAFRARKIPVTEIKPLLTSVRHRFRTSPRSFFYPRREIL